MPPIDSRGKTTNLSPLNSSSFKRGRAWLSPGNAVGPAERRRMAS